MTESVSQPQKKSSGISLRVQLYGLVILIATIAFIGSLWVSTQTTRTYLNQQMQSHAQDTATSLGLSISPYMDGENAVMVETMLSAIFDSGYYQSMVLTDIDDNILVRLVNPSVIDGVPEWFIDSFSLSAPTQTTEINSGWQIAGQLAVTSHSGVSYVKLWQHAVNNLYASLLISLLAFLLAHFILKAVLEPLNRLEKQAEAVSNKHFPLVKPLPFTRELKSVTNAMNSMVANIQKTFEQMSQHAQKLSKQNFIDDLTELGNRRAFESQFRALQAEMSDNDLATLGMIQLSSLKEVNTELGFQAGDSYVCQASEVIQSALATQPNSKLYRVNGGTFFFQIDNSGREILTLCERLDAQFSSLNSNRYPNGFAEIIASEYSKGVSLAELLSRLDTLLTQEGSSTRKGLIYSDQQTNQAMTHSRGLRQWAMLIDDLVKTDQVNFMFQPVVFCGQPKAMYFELLSQFIFDDANISNNQLYAMAERLNKSQELDKMVLNRVADMSRSKTLFKPEAHIAINLTHQSIHSGEFLDWLNDFYQKNKTHLPKIIFEVNEEAVLASIKSSIGFIKRVKQINGELCIERFGSSFTSFIYLRGLNVDYLKIDGSYIRDLQQHPENNHFIQAVTQIGHGVGIKVLATHVENQDSLELLKQLHCDGVQGNFIQKAVNLLDKSQNNLCVYSPVKVT